jgi:Zn-dependent protease
MASRLGDPTAERLGRLTLNPLPHIDLMGLILLVVSSMSGGGIGWMKPVPVNAFNFRHPRQGMMFVALSGPISNLILLGLFLLLFRLLALVTGIHPIGLAMDNTFGHVLYIFLLLNALLAVFNLLPIPPLDGGHVVEGLLPEDLAEKWERFYPFAFFLFIILIATGMLGAILTPVINLVQALALGV